MIFLFWYQQYRFFRCYGLNDKRVIVLNLVYLAVILFYVYPLKFLFTLLLAAWTGLNLFPAAVEKGMTVLDPNDLPALVEMFSIGYAVTWLILWLLYRRALARAALLELSPSEWLYTKKEARGAAWNCGVGLLAIAFALPGWVILAGCCYLLIPLLLWLNGRLFLNACRRMAGK